jgi:hypothetical protein
MLSPVSNQRAPPQYPRSRCIPKVVLERIGSPEFWSEPGRPDGRDRIRLKRPIRHRSDRLDEFVEVGRGTTYVLHLYLQTAVSGLLQGP